MLINTLNKAREKSKTRSLVLLLMILIIYVIENFAPVSIRSSLLYINIGKPIIWLIVIFVGLSFPRTKFNGKIHLKGMLIWMTTLFAGAYIFLMMLGGLITGFGKSPYDHTISGIITNLIFIFTVLIGRELVRNYLINNRTSRNYFFTIGIVAVLMTLTNLSVDLIFNLKTKLDIIKYLGESLLPEISDNILASYLVYMGGPIISIIYLGIFQCFYFLFPILPNLSWITKALIGTLCPFFSLMFLQYIYDGETRTLKSKHEEKENPLGWIFTSVISIAIVWFSVGVFPIRPFAIATGSMEPMIYAGDMVLVKKIELKDLKVGDVIQYKSDNVYIFHRLIDIVEDNQELKYQTKGDNNSISDPELVKSENIKGKVVYTIPKIGWPTLFLKSDNDVNKEKVEF